MSRQMTLRKPDYDASFAALAFFRNARQEAFTAWNKERYDVAWRLLDECLYWWTEFQYRRKNRNQKLIAGERAW